MWIDSIANVLIPILVVRSLSPVPVPNAGVEETRMHHRSMVA